MNERALLVFKTSGELNIICNSPKDDIPDVLCKIIDKRRLKNVTHRINSGSAVDIKAKCGLFRTLTGYRGANHTVAFFYPKAYLAELMKKEAGAEKMYFKSNDESVLSGKIKIFDFISYLVCAALFSGIDMKCEDLSLRDDLRSEYMDIASAHDSVVAFSTVFISIVNDGYAERAYLNVSREDYGIAFELSFPGLDRDMLENIKRNIVYNNNKDVLSFSVIENIFVLRYIYFCHDPSLIGLKNKSTQNQKPRVLHKDNVWHEI